MNDTKANEKPKHSNYSNQAWSFAQFKINSTRPTTKSRRKCQILLSEYVSVKLLISQADPNYSNIKPWERLESISFSLQVQGSIFIIVYKYMPLETEELTVLDKCEGEHTVMDLACQQGVVQTGCGSVMLCGVGWCLMAYMGYLVPILVYDL